MTDHSAESGQVLEEFFDDVSQQVEGWLHRDLFGMNLSREARSKLRNEIDSAVIEGMKKRLPDDYKKHDKDGAQRWWNERGRRYTHHAVARFSLELRKCVDSDDEVEPDDVKFALEEARRILNKASMRAARLPNASRETEEAVIAPVLCEP